MKEIFRNRRKEIWSYFFEHWDIAFHSEKEGNSIYVENDEGNLK